MQLLRQLSETHGVAGNEKAVRDLIWSEIKTRVDSKEVDAMGNLIVTKKGRKSRPRIMLAAHMDEVGLMVVNIDKQGMLKFRAVGGLDERALLSKHVLVGKDKTPGVIGAKPVHLIWRREEEMKRPPKTDELHIDIGASSKEDAEKQVKIGDYAMFDTEYASLGPTIKGKAFDDRIGCALLVELLKKPLPVTVHAAFTVQEEVGLRGARIAAFRIEPDIAIVLEGTAAGDFPEKRDLSKAAMIGKGPVITIMDRTVICDRKLVDLAIACAKKARIPFQLKRPGVGGTDAGRIHMTKAGSRTLVISVACRYVHSPASIASKADIRNAGRLVSAVLKAL
ncbi:MAG: M42 family metallopeptidase [Planctomycetota bacterium]|nr:M42 family metallopeptidase [Planctomycetota bacterium]